MMHSDSNDLDLVFSTIITPFAFERKADTNTMVTSNLISEINTLKHIISVNENDQKKYADLLEKINSTNESIENIRSILINLNQLSPTSSVDDKIKELSTAFILYAEKACKVINDKQIELKADHIISQKKLSDYQQEVSQIVSEFKKQIQVNDISLKTCSICLENEINRVLTCGHVFCDKCVKAPTTIEPRTRPFIRDLRGNLLDEDKNIQCAICRQTSTKVIKLYL